MSIPEDLSLDENYRNINTEKLDNKILNMESTMKHLHTWMFRVRVAEQVVLRILHLQPADAVIPPVACDIPIQRY